MKVSSSEGLEANDGGNLPLILSLLQSRNLAFEWFLFGIESLNVYFNGNKVTINISNL